MVKRSENRIKFKIWNATVSMEYDGTIQEGLFYGAHALTPEQRKALIDDLTKKHAELEAARR